MSKEPEWANLLADQNLKALFNSDRVQRRVSEMRKILEDPSGKAATDLHALGRARGFIEAVSFLEGLPEQVLKQQARRDAQFAPRPRVPQQYGPS